MGYFFGDTPEAQAKKDAEQTYAFHNRVDADPSVTDYMKSAWTGVQSLGSMAAAGARKVGVPGAEDAQKLIDINQQETTASMTPGGRAMAAGPFLGDAEHPSAFLQHPIKYVAFQGAPQIPLLIASAIPGGIVGRTVAAVTESAKAAQVATTGATMVTGGLLNTGDVLSSIYQQIDQMSDADMYKQSKVFKEIVDKGGTPKEARRIVENIATENAPVTAFVIGFLSNYIGAGQAIAGHAAGTAAKEGFLKGVGKTAGEEFVSEGVEETSGGYQQQSAMSAAFGTPIDWMAVLNQGLQGATLGGVMGGLAGGVTNIGGKPKDMHLAGEKPQPTFDGKVASVGGTLKPSPGSSLKESTIEPQIEPTKPGAPDAAQTVAAKNTEIAAAVPTKPVPPAYPSNKGGQIVGIGEETGQPQPPTATPSKTRYAKGKEASAVTPVQPPIGLDAAQAEALAPEMPPVSSQTAPVVQSVPAPPQTGQPSPTSPTPAEISRKFGPTEPRILPDLAAQQAQNAQLEAAVNTPDTVPGRGTPVDLTDVNNPAAHKAWRRKMEIEAKGSFDPLTEKSGGWRNENVNVIGDSGETYNANAGKLVDYHRNRISSIRQLLDCVNAS